jgi:hypothetical protein
MLGGSGWRVKWDDGRVEMVAAWSTDGGDMIPFVLDDGAQKLVPASDKGVEYTLSHPQQFTRSSS